MNSISIKATLTVLFVLMALLIGVQGYLAITKISHVNHNVQEFATEWLPTIDILGQLNANVGDFRSLEGEHLVSDTAEEMAKEERQLSATAQRFQDNMTAYEKLPHASGEKHLYEALRAKWGQYKQHHQKLIELSRANRKREAADLYKGEIYAAYGEINALIEQMLEINRNGGRRATSAASEEYEATRLEALLVIGFGLVAAVGALVFSFFGVSQPIQRITEAMSTLARGDMSVPIPFGERGNEIGAMAAAVQVFKENMIRARELEAETEAAKARAEAERKRAMLEMADGFERAVGGIVRMVADTAGELQAAAQTLSASSSQTTHQATAVAAASEQAAANVQTVAAAAEELSGSVREISRQVSDSAEMAAKAVAEANKTNAQVSGLSAGAQQIGAIVDLINDIASKTNLLALNATIEAARAGEAGRGFAVVASEVKSLAEQTSKATAEITGHIAGVQTATDEAAQAILGIGKRIDQISDIASGIAAAVEEQGAATEEIARNVDQAAQGTVEVTRNITGVSQAAESSSASAVQVLSSANALASQAGNLRTEMQKFLATVRAA